MSTTPPTMQSVALAADISGPGPYAVSFEGVDLVLLRTRGELRAFAGRCPHQGALLGEGDLDGDDLVCRNHQWRFNAQTGRRYGGPQTLRHCPVIERDGQVLCDIAALGEVTSTSRHSAVRGVDELRGPRGVPLAGNIFQIRRRQLHSIVERWRADYGSIFVMRLGPRPIVVVSEPRLSTQILRARPEVFRRASSIGAAFDGMGIAGVFSAEGEAWRPQRRLAVEALSQRHLQSFFPSLQLVTARLLRRLQAAADRGEVVDVVELIKRYTVDVTVLLTFGYDINTLEQSGTDIIQRRLEAIFPVLSRRAFSAVPLWRFIRLPSDRRLDRCVAELKDWLASLVTDARSRMAGDPEGAPRNFLEAMLVARDAAGLPFSNEMIFGNLVNMLLAGEDTTAYTLAWTVHQLCESRSSVDSLGDELDRVLGERAVPSSVELTDRLPYSAAVANETMRLRPVAPLIFLESIVDTQLDDVRLPAGTAVLVATRPPALDSSHFGHPARFQPERWLEAMDIGAHDASVHLPFGSGPRVCPGRSLALLEMKLVIATLYKNFRVERQGEPTEVHEEFSFTMLPRGLHVRVYRRGELSSSAKTRVSGSCEG